MMEQHLTDYLGKVRSAGSTATGWLNQGATDFEPFNNFGAVTLHPELQQLWSHFNGTSIPTGVHLEYTWLDGQFGYFDVARASTDYQASVDLWEQQADFEAYWPQGFVPLGTPGDGSRLLVNCRAKSPTFGAVYDLMHGDGVTLMATSLSRYFETLNAAFDEGAIKVTEQGEIVLDYDTIRPIGARINPNCDAYDDSLPSASLVKDWLEI